MAYVDDLISTRDADITRLNQITSTDIPAINTALSNAVASPKPSYVLKDRQFDWGGWLNWLRGQKDDLIAERKELMDEIQALDLLISYHSPVMIYTKEIY